MGSIKPASPEIDLRRGVDYTGVTCAFICHDGNGKILFHKRSQKCRDEQGTWETGGGALEFGEDFVAAVTREVQEEYGTTPQKIEFVSTRSVIRDNAGKKTHWVSIIFQVLVDPSEVVIGEPEKMDELLWTTLEALPDPLHSQCKLELELLKEKGLQ